MSQRWDVAPTLKNTALTNTPGRAPHEFACLNAPNWKMHAVKQNTSTGILKFKTLSPKGGRLIHVLWNAKFKWGGGWKTYERGFFVPPSAYEVNETFSIFDNVFQGRPIYKAVTLNKEHPRYLIYSRYGQLLNALYVDCFSRSHEVMVLQWLELFARATSYKQTSSYTSIFWLDLELLSWATFLTIEEYLGALCWRFIWWARGMGRYIRTFVPKNK